MGGGGRRDGEAGGDISEPRIIQWQAEGGCSAPVTGQGKVEKAKKSDGVD